MNYRHLKHSITGILLLFIFCLNVSGQTYANLPFSETFDTPWVNRDGTRDVPSASWKSTPAAGANSWSRDDDGVLRGAWASLSGTYTPAGAITNTRSARFHSTQTAGSGTLDLYLNFTKPAGSKTLTFWYINQTGSGSEKLEISLSIDGGLTFGTPIKTLTTSPSWTKVSVDLGNVTSATSIIRFKGTGENITGSDIGIDDIFVTSTPNYALLPILESFENAWINSYSTRDIPSVYWTSNPATGNNSWSREDDGEARLAWTYPWGGYSPAGANGSLHSASFHSYNTNMTGYLNLNVNFSNLTGDKALYFWYINTDGNDKLVVQLSIDEGLTFTTLNTFTTRSTWTKVALDLGNISTDKGTIRFVAYGDYGNTDIGLDNIYVGAPSTTPITSDFQASAQTGTAPFKINFTEKSTGDATSWRWDFNNDKTYDSFLQNPTHTFTASGTYSVKMVALKSGMKDSLVKTNYITINPQVYSSLPFKEGFDNTWINRDFTKDVPSNYFLNNPASGNNAWCRSDDYTRVWNSYTYEYVPSGALGTPYSAIFNSSGSSGANGILDIFVDFSTQTGSKELSFWYLNSTGSDKLEVYLSLDGGATFGSVLQTVTTKTTWSKVVVNLGSVSASTGVIRFKAYSDGSSWIRLDEVNIANNAITPVDPNFSSNIKSGIVPLTISFSDQTTGVATSWEWDFKNDGTALSSSQNPSYTYTIPGVYSVKLKTSDANTSKSITKEKFIVAGGYASLPFRETFDNSWISRDYTRDVPSAYFKNSPAFGNNSWSRNDDGVARGAWIGTYYYYTPSGANGSKYSARLHSGSIDNSGVLDLYVNFASLSGNKELSFWYINTSGTDKLEVLVSSDGGTTFGSVLLTLTTSSTWAKNTINLGALTSSTGIIRFKGTGAFNNGTDMGIDEIKINEVEAAFSSDVVTGPYPLQATFTDASLGTPTAWKWDFNNDGTIDATTQNPVYTYNTPGVYTVKLIAQKTGSSDTIIKTNYITVKNIQYATLPFRENFEKAWINLTGTRDRPSVNWFTNPATGNNSWSREDDGVARAAWSSNTGAYLPNGANNSFHSARFHTYNVSNGLYGTMDLYVDFSTIVGDKFLNFSYINTDGADKLEIYVSTDGGLTFGSVLKTILVSSSWSANSVNLGTLTSKTGVIRFKAISDDGNSDIGLDEIKVNGIDAAFAANITNGTTPTNISFTDNSAGVPTEWKWDFNNDGTIDATTQNPSYTYAAPGLYSVKLIVAKAGLIDTLIKTNYINIRNIQYASIPYSQNFENAWVNLDQTRDRPTLNWSNTPATGNNSWSREDDGVARGAWTNASGIYLPAGALNSLHSARFHSMYTTLSGNLDLYLNFSTRAGDKFLSFYHINPAGADKLEILLSTDGGLTFGTPISTLTLNANWTRYVLNLGNITSSTAIVRFKATGSSNDNSDIGLDEVKIGPLLSDYSASPMIGATPLSVNFTADISGTSDSYRWDFNNDGIPDATEQNPVYEFTTPGKYSVELVAKNANSSDSIVKKDVITVKPIQYASLPYTQNFETTWVNLDNTRDVPSVNWWNNPATGINSWSREDDGLLRGAWGNTAGYYYLPGANQTAHSARFHSYNTTLSGTLDLFVNFSTLSGDKALYFYYINTNGTDKLEVQLSTDAGATFNLLTTCSIKSDWSKICVNLGNVTSSKGILRFRAIGDNGSSDIAIDEIFVGNHSTTPVKASFVVNKTTGIAPLVINFTDQSSGDVTNWKWDLNGDGIYESIQQNPTFTYTTPGLFPIKLVAYKSNSKDSLIVDQMIKVVPQSYAPVPFKESFEESWTDRDFRKDVPSGYFCNTPASPSSFWMRFDDERIGYYGSLKYPYSPSGALGSYSSARFNTPDGSKISGNLDLYIDFSTQFGFQELSFWYINISGTDKLEVYLSKDGGVTFGSVLKTLNVEQKWTRVKIDLGLVSATKAVIRFKATGDGTMADIGIDEVVVCDVMDTPVIADFNSDKTSGAAPLTVKFYDQSVGDVKSWKWDFNNDGITDSITKNPSYTFASPGVYSVKFNAYNAESSDSITKTKYIVVSGYASLPFSENFENNWVNLSHTRDVPSYHFKNSPAFGNESWSRDDDGELRLAWGGEASGRYTPAGANSSLHSARFHSYFASATGSLDLMVDFSTLSGNKKLTFWYINTSGSDSLNVYLSTDGGFTQGNLIRTVKTKSVWTKIETELGSITSATGVIRFKVISDYGYSDIGVDDITIGLSESEEVNAKFSASTTKGLAPVTVKFNDQSTGSISSWQWDFDDDGKIDSLTQNPSFTFRNAGYYTVNLSVSRAGIVDKETKVGFIQVFDAIQADFSSSNSEGMAPFSVGFSDLSEGNPTSWKWDFESDGTFDATTQNPMFNFYYPGSYNVTLIASNGVSTDTIIKPLLVKVDAKASLPFFENFDNAWLSSRATRDVPSFFWRNAPPKANYSWSRESDGVLRGAWNSNNGAYSPNGADGTSHSARFHTYEFMDGYLSSFYLNVDFSTLAGDKTMSFYYINPDGNDKLEVLLSNDGGKTFGGVLSTQTVSASWTKVSIDLGNVTSTNGMILFRVSADLDNSDIGIDEFSIHSTNIEALQSQFTSNVNSGLVPLTVKFTNQTTGEPKAWKWDFNNDGIVDSTTQNPSFTYKKPGVYTVKLTSLKPGVIDIETKENYITVEDTVSALFSVDKVYGNDTLEVSFTDKSCGNPTSWSWDFNNDGVIDAIVQNPKFKYTLPGKYTVKLVVSKTGSTNSIVKTNLITVKKVQYAKLPFTEGFENDWINSENNRDVPAYVWTNLPATGENSWSRDDDGKLRGAWSHDYGGGYSNTAGVNNSNHYARFHSYSTYGEGVFDLHVDFSTLNGDKALYFWYLNNGGSDKLQIQISADSGKVFTTLNTYSINETWSKKTLNLGNLTCKYGIIRFKAKGDYGSTDIKVDDVFVGSHSTSPIVPDFSSGTITGYAPYKINFSDRSSGDVTNWKWDFNDDGTYEAYDQNPFYTYNIPGIYSVKMVASKSTLADSVTKRKYITILPQLYASVPFTESFDQAWVNRDSLRDVPSLYFKNSPSSGNNSWSRCNDFRAWSSYHTISYFPLGALETSYSARFNSYGSNNLVGNLDLFVDFSTQTGNKELSFWYINTAGNDKLEIQISKDGGKTFEPALRILTVQTTWKKFQFDLGTISVSKAVIRFKAIGDGNLSDIGIDEIFIGNSLATPISANFSNDKSGGSSPLKVKFTDQSLGAPSNWKWDFNNDGVTDSTSQNPSYVFTAAGLYTVKLTASNSNYKDSLVKSNSVMVHGYAKLPLYENFEKSWLSMNGTRDVPSYYSNSTPSTGNNSWSKNNDGDIRGAWNYSAGDYWPTGANESLGSARFHSWSTTGTGSLDIFVDFSTLTGSKTLSFWYINYSGSDSLNLYLSNDAGTTDGTLLLTRKTSNTWSKVTVDLGNLTSSTGRIRFKATGDNGSSDIGLDEIAIGLTGALPINASFRAHVTEGLAPLTVSFTDQTTGSPTSWKWDFNNDGIVDSISKNPSYIFRQPGKYTVNLLASSAGATDNETLIDYIQVYGSVNAEFSTNTTEGIAPLAVSFTDESTGEPSSWKWDFNNDGVNESSDRNPIYVFRNPGNYTVRLIASNPLSKDTIVKTTLIRVGSKASLPFAENFEDAWKTYVDKRDVPSFNWKNNPAKSENSWSREDDGVLRGAWSSNSGSYTPSGADGSFHSARFHSVGSIAGTTNNLTLNVDFSTLNGDKTLSFYYLNLDGTDKLEVFVSIDGGETYGPVVTTQTVSTTWTKANVDLGNVSSYDGVILFKVTSDGGSSDIGLDEISIQTTGVSAITTQFSSNRIIGIVPLTVSFTDESTGTPTSWNWDFDNDGILDEYSAKNPVYTFQKSGVYSVRLNSSKQGYMDTELKLNYITVLDSVKASFTADRTSGQAPFTVRFTNNSKGNPTSWQWDFNNDGVVDSTTQNPSFTFTRSGNYTVKLLVENQGFKDSVSRVDYISVSPATGIDTQTGSDREVSVYPSPTTSWTNVKFENFDDDKVKIEIVDLHGVVVKSYNVTGEKVFRLDCSVFARGLYYVKTICNDKVYTNTLIIQ